MLRGDPWKCLLPKLQNLSKLNRKQLGVSGYPRPVTVRRGAGVGGGAHYAGTVRGGGVLYPCPTGHGCRAPGPGEATGRQLGPLCEALSELPRSPQIGSEGAKDSEGLVRGVRRRDFSSHQHIFSFLHLFYFVHLERKTSLTASEHRIILEAGAAMGDRDRLKKPTFQDHIETGAPWALLRKWNCQKPRPQASEPREVSGETQAC